MRYRCHSYRCYQWGVSLSERDVRPLTRLHDGMPGKKRICRACGCEVSAAPPSDAGPIAVGLLTASAFVASVLTISVDRRVSIACGVLVVLVVGYAFIRIATTPSRSGRNR